jgi:transposase-like protein
VRKRNRRSFTAEQKREAVRLVQTSGQSVGQVARDLDLTETALRRWVQQAETGAGRGAEGALTSEERLELQRLRRENTRLRQERDFLKKAASFFARESSEPSK